MFAGYGPCADPEMLVGHVISVKWPSGKWYDCVVKFYDPSNGKHFVHYEDDERQWYSMTSRTCVSQAAARYCAVCGVG